MAPRPTQAPHIRAAQTKARPSQAPHIIKQQQQKQAVAKRYNKPWWAKKQNKGPVYNWRYWDAKSMVKIPLPVPNTLGSFLCVDSYKVDTVVATHASSFLVVMWMPCGIHAFLVRAADDMIRPIQMTQLAQTPHAVHLRPMRLTLRIRNTTANQDVEGVVRVVNVQNPLKLDTDIFNSALRLTQASKDNLLALTSGDPRSRGYTAKELQHTRVFSNPPAHLNSMTQYKEFQNVVVSANSGNSSFLFQDQKAAFDSMLSQASEMPLSATIVEFCPVGSSTAARDQIYEVAVNAQDACLFPTDTLQHNLQRVAPTANPVNFTGNAQAAAAASGGAAPVDDGRPSLSRPSNSADAPSKRMRMIQ